MSKKEVRKTYSNDSMFSETPSTHTIRDIVILDSINNPTYSGNICFILLSSDCQFPDNDTDCQICGTGINLNGFLTTFEQNSLYAQFSKITISAGKLFVGIE